MRSLARLAENVADARVPVVVRAPWCLAFAAHDRDESAWSPPNIRSGLSQSWTCILPSSADACSTRWNSKHFETSPDRPVIGSGPSLDCYPAETADIKTSPSRRSCGNARPRPNLDPGGPRRTQARCSTRRGRAARPVVTPRTWLRARRDAMSHRARRTTGLGDAGAPWSLTQLPGLLD